MLRRLIAILILAVAIFLTALWIEHSTSVELPAPTGPFAVGRSIADWRDGQRELLVWTWYPAAPSAQRDDYLPKPLRVATERVRGRLISNLLTRDLSKVHCHSFRDAPFSPLQKTYPIVLMRAGASGGVANYSALAEDLASHGYVIVGFDVPYRTSVVAFPDGRVIRGTLDNNPEYGSGDERARRVARLLAAWTADMGFVLDRLQQLNASDPKFRSRLDMTRIGAFGHSFGGAQAAEFCHEDRRCSAGIDIDGAPFGSVVHSGIDRPFMFLLSDHTRESGPEKTQIMADLQAIYDRLPVNRRVRIMIRGANHFTFTDDGAILKSWLLRMILRASGGLRIDGRRQLEITAYCVRTFFDASLKNRAATINVASSAYPEIEALQ